MISGASGLNIELSIARIYVLILTNKPIQPRAALMR